MITKGYTADYPYSPEIALVFEEWVWRAKYAVPIFYSGDGADFVRLKIGEIRPIRWWRQTVTRQGSKNVEYAMINFTVQHVQSPEKRMGDFCGSNHHLALDVERQQIVSASVIRR